MGEVTVAGTHYQKWIEAEDSTGKPLFCWTKYGNYDDAEFSAKKLNTAVEQLEQTINALDQVGILCANIHVQQILRK